MWTRICSCKVSHFAFHTIKILTFIHLFKYLACWRVLEIKVGHHFQIYILCHAAPPSPAPPQYLQFIKHYLNFMTWNSCLEETWTKSHSLFMTNHIVDFPQHALFYFLHYFIKLTYTSILCALYLQIIVPSSRYLFLYRSHQYN